MMTTYIRQNFGRKPQGCMLAHSVWEQSLAGVLAACGMAYTFLSEEQFAAAGCKGAALLNPACTEDQGKLLVVFPVFTSLSGMVKEGAAEVLRNGGFFPEDAKGALVTVFPVFPREKTEDALRSFFMELETLSSDKTINLELTVPGKVYRQSAFLSRLYFFPSGDSSCPQPRSFLARYPQANELYSRIHFVHNLINQLRGDKSRKRSAREELLKAEGAETLTKANSREVRRYAQKALLVSERIIREKDFKPSLLSFDLDLDRAEEYLFHDKNINCYVRTKGASVFELDYLPKGWNYLDTFGGGEKRCAFADMFFPGDFVPPLDSRSAVYSSVSAGSFPGGGRFCGNDEYNLVSADRAKLKASFFCLPEKEFPLVQ
jgi:hypothetical protein